MSQILDLSVTLAPPLAGMLTLAEYLREASLGEEELRKGHVQAAHTRFQRLLVRIENQPEETPCGPGSLDHITTLGQLGHCLKHEGNLAEAERLYRRATALSEVLLQRYPQNQDILGEQAIDSAELGDVLLLQGQYAEAKKAHEQALLIYSYIGDPRGQAVSRGQLGAIALEQRDYPEAWMRYQQALSAFRALREAAAEAIVWHQLGMVAQREQNWSEAEHCYRESLSLEEQLGDRSSIAKTCNQLGRVAQFTHRFGEAKGWYRHAIVLSQRDSTNEGYANRLTNLASCLVQEVQEAAQQKEVSLQLEEARQHAEQALTIRQVLRSPELWYTFSILATIADMQGRLQAAQAYRCQERDAYASFVGNRHQIDQQFSELFPDIVSALDDLEIRMQMKERLSQLEAMGWHISEAIQRIWAGERDWQALVENLGNQEALIVLRVLETLAESTNMVTNVCFLE